MMFGILLYCILRLQGPNIVFEDADNLIIKSLRTEPYQTVDSVSNQKTVIVLKIVLALYQ